MDVLNGIAEFQEAEVTEQLEENAEKEQTAVSSSDNIVFIFI